MSTDSSAKPTDRVKRKLPLRKKLLFLAICMLGLLLLIECGSRVVLYVANDFNPFYLMFGFVHSVEAGAHDNQQQGYSKFNPSRPVREKYRGETITMQINSDGFRADHDFVRPKLYGTFRIVALGGSSTFGYHVEDDETYTRQLEGLLEERAIGQPCEVYNLGVPHATSETILALAKAELPSLQPDVVTLYSGYNDAMVPVGKEDTATAFQVKDWLYFHSVAWRIVHPGLKSAYHWLSQATNSDIIGSPNLGIPIKLTQEQVETLGDAIVARYQGNVEQLIELTKAMDCRLVFVKQSITLRDFPETSAFGSDATYEGELELVRESLARDGEIIARDAVAISHARLMDTLDTLAAEHQIPVLDGITPLDAARDELLTYVHLSPTGNRLVAETLADGLVQEFLSNPAKK